MARFHPAAAVARPFLKWAGGKSQLLPAIRARLPDSINTYFEPFLGGGALFFALSSEQGARRPCRSVLSDVNAELIETYRVVRDFPDELCLVLGEMQSEYLSSDSSQREEMYYRVRSEKPAAHESILIASRMLFLNKTCFNGLYRVNRDGKFNVPHGRYARPMILDEANIRAASDSLQESEIVVADFEEATSSAAPGDFVYFDPPFEPLSTTSSFTAYTNDGFGKKDQVRLKSVIDRLTTRNVSALLSNSPHEWIINLYVNGGYLRFSDLELNIVPARRAINSDGASRGEIAELLVTNYETSVDSEVKPNPLL